MPIVMRESVQVAPEQLYNTDFFQRWVQQCCMGDYDVADAIIKEAISISQTFQDAAAFTVAGGEAWPPPMAMMTTVMATALMAAQVDMPPKRFEQFLREQFNLLYDCARHLFQHTANEIDEIVKRENDGALVDAAGRKVS